MPERYIENPDLEKKVQPIGEAMIVRVHRRNEHNDSWEIVDTLHGLAVEIATGNQQESTLGILLGDESHENISKGSTFTTRHPTVLTGEEFVQESESGKKIYFKTTFEFTSRSDTLTDQQPILPEAN